MPKVEAPKRYKQKAEKLSKRKQEPANDGWGAWKDTPQEDIGMIEIKMKGEEELPMMEKLEQEKFLDQNTSSELDIQDTTH